MGQYINVINDKFIGTSFNEKCQALTETGAEEVDGKEFKSNMICVVDNGNFAAAGYVYSKREYIYFLKGLSGRPVKWFVLENAKSYID